MEDNQVQVMNTKSNNDSYVEIDLVDLFFMLLSKIKGIILFAILGGLIAAGITHHFIPDKYEATAKIYIVSTSNDSVINLSDLQLGTSLTADYQELLKSRPMLESIKNNLNIDIDVAELSKIIKLENPSGTRILKITARTTDANLSRKIANEMATLSKTWLSEIMETRQPNVVEKAVMPQDKCSPSLLKNTIIGALALSFFYIAILIIKYLMDDTIHAVDEFEKYYNITPMAVLPEVGGMVDDNGNTTKRSKKSRHGKSGRR